MNGKVLDNECPKCGASIKYNIKKSKWKCEYCRSEFTLEELKTHKNASSDEVNEGINGDDTEYDVYKCGNCGAEIIADANTTSTFCIYCRSVAIIKNRLSGKFAPTKIIPFKKLKEDAISAFVKLKKGRPLIPNDFLSSNNIDKITGLYVPFWLYNVNVNGEVKFKGSKITTWRVGNTHYTKTDIYHLIRDGKATYSLIPMDGSTRFDDDIMNSIEPFNYNELVDYNHAYLSGYLSEKYDVEADVMSKEAIKRALNTSLEQYKKSITGYSNITVLNNELVGCEMGREYALLPVWMVNVKYGNKFYLFAMNGQTGQFIGNLPIDKKKSFLYFLLSFSITFILIILISYLIYISGGA